MTLLCDRCNNAFEIDLSVCDGLELDPDVEFLCNECVEADIEEHESETQRWGWQPMTTPTDIEEIRHKILGFIFDG